MCSAEFMFKLLVISTNPYLYFLQCFSQHFASFSFLILIEFLFDFGLLYRNYDCMIFEKFKADDDV